MEITITGAASTTVAPERGRLHLSISFRGRDKSRVLHDTQSRANALIAEIRALPALEDFVVSGVTSYSHRPWDGKSRRPTEHVATCHVTAIFRDFSAIAENAAAWGEIDGVDIGHTSWHLTDATRDAVRAGLVGEALDSATAKALLIAGHLGYTSVDAVRVSDQSVDAQPEARFFAATGARAEPVVEPRPEDIRLETSLTVVFEAR